MTDWPKEDIPDGDRLFYRVHRSLCRRGEIGVNVFRHQGDGMSTDWEKYSTPEESRNRAKKPLENAVVSLIAGEVAKIPGQQIEHTPIPRNRSHADVFGEKNVEVRVHLRRLAVVEIPFV